jgi:hypothetical protein
LRVSIACGKFHGVISPATPTGSRQTSTSARRAIIDFATRLVQRLALFQRHDQRQVFPVLDNQVIPAAQNLRALLRQRHRPIGKGGLRGFDRGPALRRAKTRDRRQPSAVGRIGDVETGVALSGTPGAVDVGIFTPQGCVVQQIRTFITGPGQLIKRHFD